jgi:hypothetical protein
MALRTVALCAIVLPMAALACVANEVTMKIDEALSRKMEGSRGGEPLGVIINLEHRDDLAPNPLKRALRFEVIQIPESINIIAFQA